MSRGTRCAMLPALSFMGCGMRHWSSVFSRGVLARAVLISLVVLAGCTRQRDPGDGGIGGDGGDGGTDGSSGGTLRLDPENAEVSIRMGVPATVDYHAYLMKPDGTEEDVTAEASFWVTNTMLGTFSGAQFQSGTDQGGRTRVLAMARGAMGSTDLTVHLERIFIGSGATMDDASLFSGTDDTGTPPEIVYPIDGVLVPPNLNELEWQFMPAGYEVFELSLIGEASDFRVYFGCTAVGAGCAFLPEEDVWTALAESERGRAPVRYRIRGASRSGGPVGASVEQTIGFAEEDVTGGLYYWNAAAGAVKRYDFGRRGQTAENYLDAGSAGASTCVGCHVLSRDGSRISVGLDIPSPSPYKVFETGTRTLVYQQGSMFGGGGANFFSFSPDNSQILTSNGVNIVLRDASTGAAITDPIVTGGAMPDFSPDGTRFVYAKPQTTPPCFGTICGAPGVDAASIQSMIFDGSSWGPGPEVVAFDGQNNYYPTISPDGGFVLFNRSPSNQNSYDAPDAELWIAPIAGGTPVRLDRSTSMNGDSWPKWDPTTYMHQSHPLFWFTVSSRRAYGLRVAAGTQAQLWVGAFDPSAPVGADMAMPMFWLPFQEIDSGNHIGQWVTTVDRQPCSDDTMCMGGEFCEAGVCVPELI